ncbi:DUF2512 family protein [Polycladomyces subterraneus]|uniref:DUF2512 family protein n=1 Tax=Polycladomyces subterraneus TaxID=1016997 RepID=A0ABT8INF7_9BACL|nr:DUF2512 family protein [Polycladomyces subterraneus]MDN4594283.1 DUF2512 family protein [Polycladomyces subterraneus]
MNGLLKFIIYATILDSAPHLLPDVHYQHTMIPFILALFFAVVGHFADRWILPWLGNGPSTVAGTVFMLSVMVVGSIELSYWWISLGSAVIIGMVMGAVEWVMHRYILRYRHGIKNGGQ